MLKNDFKLVKHSKMKNVTFEYVNYLVDMYIISFKLKFSFDKDDCKVTDISKNNVKHLNAIQLAFDTQKCKLSIFDIIIKCNNELMNQHYVYSCYCSFSNKELDFSTPKYAIVDNFIQDIDNNDMFFITLYIQNNYRVTTVESFKEPVESFKESVESFKEPEKPLESPKESKKRKIDCDLQIVTKEPYINLIDDVYHECGYVLRGPKKNFNPFYFEKYFEKYFVVKDKKILNEYEHLGFTDVLRFIKNCPINFNFNMTGVKAPIKAIRLSINNEYESAKYFPSGVYEIKKIDIHYYCKITEWNEVDIKQVTNELKNILQTNYQFTPVDGIVFEGIPCLIPYFRNNERKVSWGMLTKIVEICVNNKTEYIVSCNYVDDTIHRVKMFLQDIIIAKDIPFGMKYDNNSKKIVYKFYDNLKRDKKILLPNLGLK